jgi:hypothetical protein
MPSPVSDHALIRWLERVHGIDMEFFRSQCASNCADLVASGASGGWIGGQWCVVKNNAVVTFMAAKPTDSMRIRHGNLQDRWPV